MKEYSYFRLVLILLCLFNLKNCSTTELQFPNSKDDDEVPIYNIVSDVISLICSQLVRSQTILAFPPNEPSINNLRFMLHTANTIESFPLANMDSLVKSRHFNVHKKVAIFVTGWLQYPQNSSFVDDLALAYHSRGDFNFLALDDGDYLNTVIYTWAATNTETIGRHIAQSLVELTKHIPLEHIHLIGHSLGAQVVGSAGRHFTYMTGKKLPRLTGLDPAKPCFRNGLTSLFRGNGKFVDIIHTNPGVLGLREAVGDVDFYVNGMSAMVNGCQGILCAHLRSISYYTESVFVTNERHFIGVSATNLKRKEIPMGFAVPINAKGVYWVDVNPNEPFGKNTTQNFINNNRAKKYYANTI